MTELSDRIARVRARIAAANKMVDDLCHRAETGQEWIMHIPARRDLDPDLVIGAALQDAAYLADQCERLTTLLAAADRVIEARKTLMNVAFTKHRETLEDHVVEADAAYAALKGKP